MFNTGVKCSEGRVPENTPYTLVVIGLNRGGTSAIAGVLSCLGLPMGHSAVAPVYEDRALADAFRARQWGNLKHLLRKYHRDFGSFGWKLPDSFTQLSKVNRYCNNPRYVVVYRDIFAIANRQEMAGLHDASLAMKRCLSGYKAIVEFFDDNKVPVLHLSYEKLLQHPEIAVKALIDFCQLDPSKECVDKAIVAVEPSPPGYLSWATKSLQSKFLIQHGYSGYLDSISVKRVTGWAVHARSSAAVEVQLFVNNVWQQSTYANLPRPDVQRAGCSKDGLVGYAFSLKQALTVDDEVSVRVRSLGGDVLLELIGSPAKRKKL